MDAQPAPAMQRVVVTGTPGSGKTTLARALAARLGLPVVELAALYWEADWQPAAPDVFAARLHDAMQPDGWVLDGLYRKDITWAAADTLVWLDYPLAVVWWRLLRRTLRRIRTGETVWGTTNRETVARAFFRRDALLWTIPRAHCRRRRRYARRLARPEYAHLTVIRLRSPRAAEAWLRGLA